MKNSLLSSASVKDPWECSGMPIPEIFPTRMAFLKTVFLGVGITAAIYGVLSLLLLIHS